METTQDIVAAAIARSASHTETVHIDGASQDTIRELIARCDDWTDTGVDGRTEYWGTTDEGDEWRITATAL